MLDRPRSRLAIAGSRPSLGVMRSSASPLKRLNLAQRPVAAADRKKTSNHRKIKAKDIISSGKKSRPAWPWEERLSSFEATAAVSEGARTVGAHRTPAVDVPTRSAAAGTAERALRSSSSSPRRAIGALAARCRACSAGASCSSGTRLLRRPRPARPVRSTTAQQQRSGPRRLWLRRRCSSAAAATLHAVHWQLGFVIGIGAAEWAASTASGEET
jgi:hypothetical protein